MSTKLAVTIESYYGDDLSASLNEDGSIREDAFYVTDVDGSIGLSVEDVEALAAALIKLRALSEDKKAAHELPTEPGLYTLYGVNYVLDTEGRWTVLWRANAAPERRTPAEMVRQLGATNIKYMVRT